MIGRLALALVLAAAFTTPSAAQSCDAEINAVWSAVQASELDDMEKNQVASVLQSAQRQSRSGDEEGCRDTVAQVRTALGIAG